MRAVIGVETGVPFIMLYEYAVFWLSRGVILGQSPAAAWHWLLCVPAWPVFLQFLFCLPPSLAQFVFKRFFATLIKRFLHATAHTIHVRVCVAVLCIWPNPSLTRPLGQRGREPQQRRIMTYTS